MLYDDSLELEHDVSCEGPKLIRMKDWSDIKLSNIWIPSELLPNRQAVAKSNGVQFSIYHTLKRPLLLSDSFSTYSDQSKNVYKNNFNDEELLDSLEEVTLCADQKSYQCLTAEENNKIFNYLDSNKDPLDGATYLLEDLSLDDTDYLNLLQNTEDSDINMEENKFTYNQSTENPTDNAIDLGHTNVHHNKNLNSNLICKSKVTSNSVISSVSPNIIKLNTSNDHAADCGKLDQVNLKTACLSQTSDYDLFSKDSLESCPYVIRNSSCSQFWNASKSSTELYATSVGKPVQSIYHAKEDSLVSKMSNVDYEFNKSSSSSVVDEINLECNDVVAKFFTLPKNYDGTYCYDNSFVSNSSSNLLEGNNEKLKTNSFINDNKDIENDINISGFQNLKIYQRSDEISTVNSLSNYKKKSKKEKKMKQKSERSMAIEDFFLDPNEAKYMEPKIDEFYESIIRKKNMKDADNPISNAAFPPLPEKQVIVEPFDKLENSESNQSISKNAEAVCLSDNIGNYSKNRLIDNEFVNNVNTIIIENIPLGINEEMLRNLLLIYGDIKSLNITRRKEFLKAEIIVDIEDPVWIIESLDGTQPFGASSEVLKCYLKS